MEKSSPFRKVINNQFYDELEDKWFSAKDHPIALLRAENRLRIPWIIEEIEKVFGKRSLSILDMGCGAGFLAHALSQKGHNVTGIDLSSSTLEVAKQYDRDHNKKKNVTYQVADALHPPFKEESFDVVTAMDILEHVDHQKRLLQQAAKLLKPGGLFFFHTFNRNLFSYLLIIKGVEWFVKNSPKDMHIYRLFLSPKKLSSLLKEEGLEITSLRGFRPKFFQKPLLKLLYTREVEENFSFCFSKSCLTGYCGIAQKRGTSYD